VVIDDDVVIVVVVPQICVQVVSLAGVPRPQCAASGGKWLPTLAQLDKLTHASPIGASLFADAMGPLISRSVAVHIDRSMKAFAKLKEITPKVVQDQKAKIISEVALLPGYSNLPRKRDINLEYRGMTLSGIKVPHISEPRGILMWG